MRDSTNARDLPDAGAGVIAVDDLGRRFGEKVALDGVSFRVPQGSVFGLVGENGAGKTTLIKHFLGLLRAQSGSVRVFGSDPVADPVGVLGRIGYLSEQPDLPGWMRVHEFVRYMRAFYPRWDEAYAQELFAQYSLDSNARVKTLSKGQQAKLGLLVAQAHRPDLLLLDEPSSGLDPIVRKDILAAVIRTVSDEGRTVFFSSHLLEEIERVSDHIAMLHKGRLVLCGKLDEVKALHRKVTFAFDTPQVRPPVVRGALSVTGSGREWTALCAGYLEWTALALSLRAVIVNDVAPSLDEIFTARASAPVAAHEMTEEALA